MTCSFTPAILYACRTIRRPVPGRLFPWFGKRAARLGLQVIQHVMVTDLLKQLVP
jgi:hypothetical protein